MATDLSKYYGMFSGAALDEPGTGAEASLIQEEVHYWAPAADTPAKKKMFYAAYLFQLACLPFSLSEKTYDRILLSLMATLLPAVDTKMVTWGYIAHRVEPAFWDEMDKYWTAATAKVKDIDGEEVRGDLVNANLTVFSNLDQTSTSNLATVRAFLHNTATAQELEPETDVEHETLVKTANSTNVYGLLGAFLFLAAKSASRMSAVTWSARLLAVKSKYVLTEHPFYSGSPTLSEPSAEGFYAAFARQARARKAIFDEVANALSDTSLSGSGALGTNAHLLKNAGMAYVVFIDNLLQSKEWVKEWRLLAPSLDHYRRSCEAFLAMPQKSRWFYKIAMGDQGVWFSRKEMGPLIAVAREVAKRTSTSVEDFFEDREQSQTVATFRNLETRRSTGQAVDWSAQI